jgi:hypothetical protein
VVLLRVRQDVLLCNHLECRSLAVRQRNKLDGSKASCSKRCEAIEVSELERRVSLGFGLVCAVFVAVVVMLPLAAAAVVVVMAVAVVVVMA